MRSVFVGRQPIFDQNRKVYAYEILFRSGETQSSAPKILDAQLATIEVTSALLNDIGLKNVVGGQKAFINISYDYVLNRHSDGLPKESVVLEVLEDTQPTREVIGELQRLSEEGYTIALDDVVYSDSLDALIEIADIIKVELPAIDENKLGEQVKKLREIGGNKRLLAEKVETHETFQNCLDLGFDLFQGYFFCKPEVVSGAKLASNKISSLRLLKQLQDPEAEIADIANVLQTDPMLCLKLLRFVNSSQFHLSREIDSIKSAITIAGIKKVRSFAKIAIITSLATDKPPAIILEALAHAKMCEEIAKATGRDTDKYFTAGLFSLIDAILDQPIDVVLSNLSLDSEITDAIQHSNGPMADIVGLVGNYSKQTTVSQIPIGISGDAIQHSYLNSLAWANETLEELGACV